MSRLPHEYSMVGRAFVHWLRAMTTKAQTEETLADTLKEQTGFSSSAHELVEFAIAEELVRERPNGVLLPGKNHRPFLKAWQEGEPQ